MTLESSCVEYKQPHSIPGEMPEADICFAFLGSGQSLPGVAEWHSLLSICKHCNRSSLGQLAVLCTRVTCHVFEPTDQHSLCILGSTTLHILGPARAVLLPGRKQTSSQLLPYCHCCLVPAIWNFWRLFIPHFREWEESSSAALYPKDATELSMK